MSDPSPTGPVLRTERLELRPFSGDDAAALHALFVDPEVRRFLLDDQVVEPEWVEGEIAGSRRRFAGGGLGLWTIRRRNEDRVIGFVGFREFFEPPQLQLVYGLLPAAWGEGLATEAAREAIRCAFEDAGLVEVVAATDPPNRASMGVMDRLGMSFLEQARVGGQPTVFYRLRRPAAGG
ncbi:MAG TPA: GNAT family N-acetyltransferase [Thermoanaerobaculia bacterium]|nr:GNAT family N-acetyltransferase [Thermoanaerobaculia bacterium]